MRVSMPVTAFHPKTHAEILHSVFDLTGSGMNKPLAEAILKLDFPPGEVIRMDAPSVKANDGTLTGDEATEFDAYIQVEDLPAYWQAKAQEFLKPLNE